MLNSHDFEAFSDQCQCPILQIIFHRSNLFLQMSSAYQCCTIFFFKKKMNRVFWPSILEMRNKQGETQPTIMHFG